VEKSVVKPVALAEAVLADGRTLRLVPPTTAQAPAVLEIIRDAFSHRAPVNPPPAALGETVESVSSQIESGFGILALVDDEPAGVVLVSIAENGDDGHVAGIHRVSVAPRFQRQGIASVMAMVALEELPGEVALVRLTARTEFPHVLRWWRRLGFSEYARSGNSVELQRRAPVRVAVPVAKEMQDLGWRLSEHLRAGDLIIASGDLGAGKTTLAQGIGMGLGSIDPVVSPTFVLSRVHQSASGRPAFVHVDAYRLGSLAELEDIDVGSSLDDSVTLVEWGAGIAEGLSDERLEIDIRRSLDPQDETRWVFITSVGARWKAPELRGLTWR
jgi:tRNA threonylcarbamoyladenosine biosynthesis protein TsaE